MRSARAAAIAFITCMTAASAHANAPSWSNSTFFVLQGTSSGDASIDAELASDLKLALADKGWLEVAPQDAQTVVITHAATPAKHSIEAFYAGWGDWNWRTASQSASRDEYKPGGLLIDCFDATTRELLWRMFAPGIVKARATTGTFNTEHRVDRIARAIPRSATGPEVAAIVRMPAAHDALNIVFAPAPVAVVSIDGPPVYQPIGRTEFQRIVNTRSFIVRDDAGMHFLKLSDRWMEADALMGPWTAAGALPVGAEEAFEQDAAGKSLTFSEPLYGARTSELSVVVTTQPVTLVATDGEVQFTPLEGTSLLWARNTSAPVLKEPTDKELYVRVGDRWYRSWTFDGPWQNVPAAKLPADFGRLPAQVLEHADEWFRSRS